MTLEARAENCCSSTFILKLDGRPHGKFEGRWFSEGLDVQCTGRQRLQFQNVRWLGSEFVLQDLESQQTLARAVRSGIFTSSWDVELSIGQAQLVHAGWFDTAYLVQQDNEVQGRVDRLGMCDRGWYVQSQGDLDANDMIFIGLLYHTILQRERRQHAAHGGGFHGS
jgi:hypothetical protein